MKLLYRPKRHLDELAWDFLARTAEGNGFTEPKTFIKLFADYGSQFGMHGERQKNEFLKRCGATLGHDLSDHTWSSGFEYTFLRNKAVLCEECWGESPYRRCYWWLTGYTNCHVHNKPLIPENAVLWGRKEGQDGLSKVNESDPGLTQTIEKIVKYTCCSYRLIACIQTELNFWLFCNRWIIPNIIRVSERMDETYHSIMDFSKLQNGDMIGLYEDRKYAYLLEFLSIIPPESLEVTMSEIFDDSLVSKEFGEYSFDISIRAQHFKWHYINRPHGIHGWRRIFGLPEAFFD